MFRVKGKGTIVDEEFVESSTESESEEARSLVTRWLPFALALSTGLAVVLARGALDGQRILRRHFWGYLAVPATFALVAFGDHVATGVLGAPYVALVAFIAWCGLAALWRSRDLRSDRAFGRLLGLIALAAMLALLPYEKAVQRTESDEPHYLIIMQSLVRDHDLDLKNEYDDADYADFYSPALPDRHVIGSGSSELPIRDLGLPILGAIPFAIARRTGVLVLMCLMTAAFAWRGYRLLRVLTVSRDASFLAVAAVAFLHPLFTYSTQIYPDVPAALVVLLVAELLARPPTTARLAAASALLGTMPWLTVRGWLPVVGIGSVVAYQAIRPLFRGITRDRLTLIAAGALPFAALILGLAFLDYRLFGIPIPNAGYLLIRDAQPVLVYSPQVGVPGVFLDRSFGLLSRAPVFALMFFGAVPVWRLARATRSPALVALFLGWLCYLVYIGDIAYWWADGSPSSRYQLATIAFPMVAVAAGIDRLRGEVPRLMVLAGVWWTVAVTAVFALYPNLRYDISTDVVRGDPGKLWVFVSRALRVDPGLLFPSLVRGATADVVLVVAWTVFLAGLVVLGARRPPMPAALPAAAVAPTVTM